MKILKLLKSLFICKEEVEIAEPLRRRGRPKGELTEQAIEAARIRNQRRKSS